jgi:hypothetical protein
MTKRLAARVAKIEQSSSVHKKRYVLLDDEQPTAAELARGQKFVRVPRLCSTSAEWLELFAPNGLKPSQR